MRLLGQEWLEPRAVIPGRGAAAVEVRPLPEGRLKAGSFSASCPCWWPGAGWVQSAGGPVPLSPMEPALCSPQQCGPGPQAWHPPRRPDLTRPHAHLPVWLLSLVRPPLTLVLALARGDPALSSASSAPQERLTR